MESWNTGAEGSIILKIDIKKNPINIFMEKERRLIPIFLLQMPKQKVRIV